MKEHIKDNILKTVTTVIILLVLFVGIVKWVPVLNNLENLKKKDAALDAEIAAVNLESSEYSERVRRFQSSSEQVESIARRDHRVYPGEVVFVFPEKNSK